MLQTFNDNLWWLFTASVEDVSSSGSGAGIAAASHRWSTLKGTKVSNLYNSFK